MGIFSWRKKQANDNPEREMAFVDHLEELRWHLVRSAVAVFIFATVLFIFRMEIIGDILLWVMRGDFPTYKLLCPYNDAFCFSEIQVSLQSISPYEKFTLSFTYAFSGGLIIAFPYICWELWKFVKPALSGNEKGSVRGTVFFVSSLFFLGVLFGYFVLLPFATVFLSTFELFGEIPNQWHIGKVINFVMTALFGCGLLFQLPAVMYLLSKIGIVTPLFLRKYRRHSIVVLLLLSAIFTPPDVLSQIAIFIPLYALYELGIGLSERVYRKKQAKLKN